MKYILIIYCLAFQQINCLYLKHSTFKELKTCLINSGVSNNTIFDQISTLEEYNKLNSQWNTRHGIIYPMAYLVPENVTDIQTAVICGKLLNIRVLPKAGGHNFEKYTYGDSQTLVVDLQKLNYVNVDKDKMVAIVGAGTRQGKLAYNLWEQGKVVTSYGLCPSVGVAGYTLGGGKGAFSRRHGLMIDNVIEMELIDSSGRLIVANSKENPDLFWALRGAGAVSFGIVTRFTYRLYKAPTEVFSYYLTYNMTDFPAIISAYQDYSVSNLTNTFGSMRLRATHIVIRFDELRYTNEEFEYGKLISLFPTAYNITSRTAAYPDYLMNRAMETFTKTMLPNVNIRHPSNLTLIGDSIGRSYYHRKSFQLKTKMTSAQINRLFDLYKQLLPSRVWIEEFRGKVSVQNFGSEDQQKNQNYTPFIHRNDVLNFAIAYESDESYTDWMDRARTFLAETQTLLGHTTTYQNYVDGEIVNFLERYYGSNSQRLIEIKTKYDPGNFFHTPQSIPVVSANVNY